MTTLAAVRAATPGVEAGPAPADLPQALMRGDAWPDGRAPDEVVETHHAWVFLTAAHAWKLKKPRRWDGLDLRGPQARRWLCEEEVRLNRRLAPQVYLRVAPVAGTARAPRVDGSGPALDWLVQMRRLEAHRMLDALLARHLATADDMARIARGLAAFQAAQPPARLTASRWGEQLLAQLASDEALLCEPALGLPADRVRALCAGQRDWLAQAGPLLRERIGAGRVIEGHGDLRPEHVWLGEPLAIIDCLEFSAALRTTDCADEVGFLALGCERAGAPALADALLAHWREAARDPVPATLVHGWQSGQARTRARLALAHLQEARYRGDPRWLAQAVEQLEWARLHLQSAQGGAR